MFWSSVIQGLRFLISWEIWIAFVLYTLGTFSFLIYVQPLLSKLDPEHRRDAVFSFTNFGGPVFDVLMLSMIIASLTPLWLGFSGAFSPVILVLSYWKIVLFVAAVGLIVDILLLFMLRRFGQIGDGLRYFLKCAAMFRIHSEETIKKFLNINALEHPIYPSLWESIGYFLIAAILVVVAWLSLSAIADWIEKRRSVQDGRIFMTIVTPFMTIFSGFLPLLMYSQFARLSIQSLISGN